MAARLEPIFNAKSVAIVGASNRPNSVGNGVVRNLLGTYQGVVYPVNSKERSILGVQAYKSLADLPSVPDLVVVAVPTKAVIGVVQAAGRCGVKGAVILTAGFKEVGPKGAELEQEMVRVAREHGVALVGPNCFGVISSCGSLRMNASFAASIPKEGSIALVTQSGALCAAVLVEAERRSLGFSRIASIGNKAEANEREYLRWFGQDRETRVICLYLEDIGDFDDFAEAAEHCGKPVVILKSGNTKTGLRASMAHTGAKGGAQQPYTDAFERAGVLRVKSIVELVDAAQALSMQPLPRGPRVVVVTNGGGTGIVTTDALEDSGLTMAVLSEETQRNLRTGLPPFASALNPVDIIGDARADRYRHALGLSLRDDGVDAAVVIQTLATSTNPIDIAKVVAEIAKMHPEKPVLCSFVGLGDTAKASEYLHSQSVPNFPWPDAAARALASMVYFGQRQGATAADGPGQRARL